MTNLKQPAINFQGVDIPDYGDGEYPYGVIEVTKRCNLRCKTCFFFQAFQHLEKDLPDAEMIEGLRALQRRHRIKSMSWVGGEPCLRPKVLEAASDIFPHNVVFTNGTLPIPNLPLAFGISLDGPPDINDAVRGEGVYEKVMKTVREAPNPVFFQTVVSKKNFPVLESYTDSIASLKNTLGIVFSIYVPQKNDSSNLWFSLSERNRLIEKLLRIKDKHREFALIPRGALELMLPETCRKITDNCDMKTNSLALDYRLQRRQPCCYGENVDCDLCAAPTPFIIQNKIESRKSGLTKTKSEEFPYNLNRQPSSVE